MSELALPVRPNGASSNRLPTSSRPPGAGGPVGRRRAQRWKRQATSSVCTEKPRRRKGDDRFTKVESGELPARSKLLAVGRGTR